MLKGPEFTCRADTCLSLIYYERDSFIFGNASNLSVEVRSCHMVFKGSDGLDDHCSYILTCVSSLFNDIFISLDASVLLLSVFMLEFRNWVLNLWEGSIGPAESRQTLQVNLSITA